MADKEFNFSTLCLHAGQIPDSTTGSRAAPIYRQHLLSLTHLNMLLVYLTFKHLEMYTVG